MSEITKPIITDETGEKIVAAILGTSDTKKRIEDVETKTIDLQNQIDSLPETAEVDEVVNARNSGVDGTSYADLKKRLDTESKTSKDNRTSLTNILLNGEGNLYLNLKKSKIDSSTGIETDITTATTTAWTAEGYYPLEIIKSIIIPADYTVGIFGYDESKMIFTFYGYKKGEVDVNTLSSHYIRFTINRANWKSLTKEEAMQGLFVIVTDRGEISARKVISDIAVRNDKAPDDIEIGHSYDPTTGISPTFNALYKNYVYDVSNVDKVFVEREVPKYHYFYFFVNEYGDLSTEYKNNGTSSRATCSEWVSTKGYKYLILPCNTGFGSYVEDSIVVKVNKKYTLQEVSEQVFENKNTIADNKDFETRYEMFLPEKIYEVRGHEMNIYWKNLIRNFDEIVLATTSLYSTFSNYKQITLDCPVGDDYSIKYDYYANNKNMDKLGHFEIPVKCVEESAKTGNIKAMFIGDSLIGYGIITDTLLQTFNTDSYSNIELVGTRNEVNSEYTPVYPSQNKHEGRGGWTTNDYRKTAVKSSITNPFYNSETDDFDFAYYMSHQSVSIPDYVFIYLGTNDVWHNINALTTAENIKHMINSIHAYNPSIKVCISYIKTGYKGLYKSGTNYPTDLVIKRNFDINVELQKQFSNKASENIFTVPVCFNIDEENGYKLGTRTENTRDTDEVAYCIDGTHPKVSAFKQMADSFYAFIKCN